MKIKTGMILYRLNESYYIKNLYNYDTFCNAISASFFKKIHRTLHTFFHSDENCFVYTDIFV